jgi:hypothetical protein
MSKLPSQELDIHKNYVLNEILKAFKKYGDVEPEHLKQLLDIDIEISEVTDLIYPKIKFTNDFFSEYKSLDRFNLIEKPNNLFDDYHLEEIEVPLKILSNSKDEFKVTPYSSESKIKSFIKENEDKLKQGFKLLYNTYKTKELILTNGDEQTFNFIDEEYTLPIDYTKEKRTELDQYKKIIKELLLPIFKKVRPISSEKLALLVNKHYNSED